MPHPHPDPHPDSAELAYASAPHLQSGLRAGDLTSVQLVECLVGRMAVLDGPDSPVALRSVLAIHPEALSQAAQCDAERASGLAEGRLHGLPVLVKDNIEAVGLPGSAGSLALADRSVVADSPLIARLRQAGAIVLGATNLSEWANFRSPDSTSGWSAGGGLTGNPWALDRSPGGSSSGSGAAVAAGLTPWAVGTETNGSITCPAALNGVVGIKPTVGSVPTQGVVPISRSQDVPGPLARSVREAAALLEILSGSTGLVTACDGTLARDIPVAIADGWLTGHADTDACFAGVLDTLAPLVGSLTSRAIPATGPQTQEDQVTVLVGEQADDLDAYLASRAGVGVRSLAELIAFNRDHADTEMVHFGQEFLEQSLASGGRAGSAYREARERNLDWARAAMGVALDSGDRVVVAPAYPPAWKSDLAHVSVLAGGGQVCMAPAILGWPIVTVPMGLAAGLPVGLCVTGPAGSELTLLAVAQAVEDALGLAVPGAFRPVWSTPVRG